MAQGPIELIVTKLFPPISRGGLIGRSRLLDRLQSQGERRLTLVSAPAGFGKTTLLAQWHDVLAAKGMSCCWLSLDDEDREPSRFLRYFVAALQTVAPSCGARALELLNSGRVNIASVIARVINEIAESDGRFAIFIDDYHLADSGALNEAMQLLLARAPHNLQYIIASRAVPNLLVSELRVRDEVTEFGATELRFDEREARDFILRVRGLSLNTDQLRLLQEQTEGWAAGLQLASLWLKEQVNRDDFFSGFSGNLRDIAEYLASGVLNNLQQGEQDFLLKTSILDRFNARLCNLLTDRDDSHLMLERMEAANLFLQPLDGRHVWYRYHHLFGEFLRSQLRRRYGGEMTELYRRAREWFTAEGFVSEAVHYALEGGDFDTAAALVQVHATHMMHVGQMVQINSWIDKIPASMADRHPRLHMFRCWALFHMRQPSGADEALKCAEKAIAELEADARQRNDCMALEQVFALREEEKVLRAGIAIAFDDVEQGEELASADIAANPAELPWLAGVMANIHGYACLSRSKFKEAEASLVRARHFHEMLGSVFGVVYSDCFLGLSELAQGNLHRAAALFQQAEDVALKGGLGQRSAGTAVARVLRAVVLYEWGRIDEADDLIRNNFDLVEECSHIEVETKARITLARIHTMRGAHDQAVAVLNGARHFAARNGFGRQLVQYLDEMVCLSLRAGDSEAAFDIAEDLRIDLDAPPQSTTERWDRIAFIRDLIRVRLLIDQCAYDSALAGFVHLRGIATHFGRRYRVIQMAVLESVTLARAGKQDAALERFREALTLAQPEGYITTIIGGDPRVKGLILALRERLGSSSDHNVGFRHYLGRLLSECDTQIRRADNSPAQGTGTSSGQLATFLPPVEALNARESEVLNLIALGRTNRDIARQLAIAENTVKWHVKNIFEKLSVVNRTMAVGRARELGLL